MAETPMALTTTAAVDAQTAPTVLTTTEAADAQAAPTVLTITEAVDAQAAPTVLTTTAAADAQAAPMVLTTTAAADVQAAHAPGIAKILAPKIAQMNVKDKQGLHAVHVQHLATNLALTHATVRANRIA